MSRIGRCILPYGGSGGDPDPATYCPTNGYIDPTQPNDDWLILPRNTIKYGLLYNSYAVIDARNIAGVGWHVPDITEFTTFCSYVGSTSNQRIKDANNIYWRTGTTNTNELLFNARGAGARNAYTGVMGSLTETLYYWQSIVDHYESGVPFNRVVSVVYSNGNLGVGGVSQKATHGFSVRLIKDSTTLSPGETGFYVDPSGFVYRTICVGTQEWVADNIKTQHYRNGDAIPEITDNTAWAALTTGALCAYNNDWSNV